MAPPRMRLFRSLIAGCLGAAAILAVAPGLVLADPLTVTFPTLGVEAQTEQVEVLDGQLEAPADPDNLGVYQLQGNLVMVGHVDWAGQPRALSFARSFQGGEPIELSDGRTYHVVWSKTLSVDDDQGEWAEAVAPADDVLTLVTCTGPFSRSRQMYLERIVIRAVRDG